MLITTWGGQAGRQGSKEHHVLVEMLMSSGNEWLKPPLCMGTSDLLETEVPNNVLHPLTLAQGNVAFSRSAM